jgi:hypothetical protein
MPGQALQVLDRVLAGLERFLFHRVRERGAAGDRAP